MRSATLSTLVFCLVLISGASAISVDWRFPDPSTACIGAKLTIDNVVLKFENQTAEVTFANATAVGGPCGSTPGVSASSLIVALPNEDKLVFQFSVSGSASDAVTRMDLAFNFDPTNYFENVESEIVGMSDVGDTQLSPPDMLYKCISEDTKEFADSSGNYTMSMTISNVEIQAFNMNGNFTDEVSECAADESTSVAPATTKNTQTSVGPTEPTAPKTSEAPSNTSTEGPTSTPSTNGTSEAPASNGTTSESPETTIGPTTVAPTTAPPPAATTYVYEEGDKICAIMKASVQVQVTYDQKNKTEPATTLLDVPPKDMVTITGSCPDKNDTTAKLGINFGKEGAMRNITFEFSRDLVTDDVYLMSVAYDIDLNKEEFPDAKEAKMNVTYTNLKYGKTTGERYFKCDAMQTIGKDEVKLITRNLQIETFGGFSNQSFAETGYECEEDTGKQPDVAPKNNYKYKDNTLNVTCIVFQGALSLTLPYMRSKEGGGNESATATVKLPEQSKVSVSGSCGDENSTSQFIELSFFDGWTLKLIFKSDAPEASNLLTAKAGKNYHLDYVYVTYVLNNNLFPDVVNPGEAKHVNNTISADTFSTKAGQSYMCSKDQNLDLGSGAQLTTKDMQFEAFRTKDDFNDFSTPQECAKDDETNSIVPIAVGAALAGLVIIVLIAYLIGRRRSRSGYEQV